LWASDNVRKLRGFARSLTHNSADADELLQEACARVLAEPQLYDASRPFDTWVGHVLLNAFRDRNKSFAWTRVTSLDLEDSEDEPVFPEALSNGQPSHLDELLADESRQHVAAARMRRRTERHQEVRCRSCAAALRQLPEAHREILTLCDIEALSYEDAARKLGVPLGTVRSRRARACAALFRLLQED
jgi:RNA polymerase sigma-70 factor (ECF subfamily)